MSTVHICLKDIVGVAVKCEVIFYPGDTPFQNGAALAVSGRRSIWLDDDGTKSVELAAGRYAVRFGGLQGNTDTLIIEVPDDNATHELASLITAGNWVLPFRDFLQKANNFSDVADAATAFANIKQTATAESTGVVQLATQAEVNMGMDDAKPVTSATFANASKWGGYATKDKYVFLTADAPTVTGTTTMTDIPGLLIALQPGTYQVMSYVSAVATGSTNGIRLGMAIAYGSYSHCKWWSIYGKGTGSPATVISGSTDSQTVVVNGDASSQLVATFGGVLILTGSTNLSAQVSQYTSGADIITPRLGAYIIVRKLA